MKMNLCYGFKIYDFLLIIITSMIIKNKFQIESLYKVKVEYTLYKGKNFSR